MPERRLRQINQAGAMPSVSVICLLTTKPVTSCFILLFLRATVKRRGGTPAPVSFSAGSKTRNGESASMTRASTPTTTHYFGQSFHCPDRRMNEEQSGVARKHRYFFRRGAWVRGLFLYFGDPRACRVPLSLLALARCADVERFGKSLQGHGGDDIVGHSVFRDAGSESGVCFLEISDTQTLAS